MSDLIEKIGPIVGVVAFLGLAILAFLIFQQAREIRRLREWAGRAPERAAEAIEATAAAAEARGEAPPEHEDADVAPRERPAWMTRLRERFAPAWAELDRRSPVDPRYFVIVLAAAVVAAGVLTSGFGVFGGGEEGSQGGRGGGAKTQRERPKKVRVTVLNATQDVDVNGQIIPGVQGLADLVATEVVRPAGFAIAEKADAPQGLDATTIFFEQGRQADAQRLAEAVEPDLGVTDVEPMIADIEAVAGGAPLALAVGRDDADAFGTAPVP